MRRHVPPRPGICPLSFSESDSSLVQLLSYCLINHLPFAMAVSPNVCIISRSIVVIYLLVYRQSTYLTLDLDTGAEYHNVPIADRYEDVNGVLYLIVYSILQ